MEPFLGLHISKCSGSSLVSASMTWGLYLKLKQYAQVGLPIGTAEEGKYDKGDTGALYSYCSKNTWLYYGTEGLLRLKEG